MAREEFEHGYDPEELHLITPRKRDFKMLVSPGHAGWYCENAYEDFTSDLLLNFFKGNMLFIDIGASYGYYTLLVGTKHPDCKIIAFEPVPESFEILKRNVALNQMRNAELHALAVSDKDEVRKLKVTELSSQSGFYEQRVAKTLKEIEVRTVHLDRFLEKTPKVPTIIKIDAEGHEPYILQGMKKFLRDAEDVKLFIEFNPDCLRNAGYEPTQFLEEVCQFGFDLYVIDDDRRMTYKLGQGDFGRWTDYLPDGEFQKTYANILCIKKQESLSVLFFSHSSQLTGQERSLLELTKQAADNNIVCSVVLPSEGPLRGKLDEAGASTLVIGYHWWCDSALLPDEEIKSRLSSSFENAVNKLGELSKINPDVVYTNTLVIPWGAVAAFFLGKPHVWFIHEFGEFEFHLPFQTVLKVIKNSSSRILVNSDAVRNTLFKTTRSKNILTLGDDSAEEKMGAEVLELLRKLKGTVNPWQDAFSQLGAQATLTDLQTKDSRIAKLSNTLDTHIKDAKIKLQEKTAHIAKLETSLHELQYQMQQIQQGIPMQLVTRYQRIVERLLGQGTRRRRCYELMLTGIRVILNEGWRSFWNKFRQRL